MKEVIKTILAMCFTLLFIGLAYPEYIFTDDVIVVVDEDGNQIGSFWDLPGTMEEKIRACTEGIQNETYEIEPDFRWLPLNAKDIQKNP